VAVDDLVRAVLTVVVLSRGQGPDAPSGTPRARAQRLRRGRLPRPLPASRPPGNRYAFGLFALDNELDLCVTVVDTPIRVPVPALEHPGAVGPIGRLGRWAADHVRAVAIAWAILAVALGVFAPKVESALSGAGWQANGSESVQARTLIERNFAGLSSSALMVVVHSQQLTTSENGFRHTIGRVEHVLRGNSHVRSVVPPHAGSSISADGHTAVVIAGAKDDPTAMVAAADTLKSSLKEAGTAAVTVSLTGASGMWSAFNTANRNAMLKSELFSWLVTMAILVLAFGALVAAGLPLLLTILGLVASAGLLALLTHGFEISIWAMNFALMFALALSPPAGSSPGGSRPPSPAPRSSDRPICHD
jgi:MMPL family